jgi:uncharacterized protein
MTPVFMDTVGMIALWDEADQWHDPASVAAKQLAQRPVRLVTSSVIFLECGNAAARRPYRRDVQPLLDQFAMRGDLLVPTDAEVDRAWQAYHRGPAGGPSIIDHVSFEVMRRLGVTEAFTNDRHFVAAGFEVLF